LIDARRLPTPYYRLKNDATNLAKRRMKRRFDGRKAARYAMRGMLPSQRVADSLALRVRPRRSTVARNRVRRIRDPLAPRARIDARPGQAGDAHREGVVARRHTGAALMHDRFGQA
jgi:hypothetical protein